MAAAGTAARAASVPGAAPVTDPASLVNPLIGTSGGVNEFPGPDGMIQWSPDTSPSRPDGGGYAYTASQIAGYNLTSGISQPVTTYIYGGDIGIFAIGAG